MTSKILQKLKALDLSKLTEPDRQATILEIKNRLDALAAIKPAEAELLLERIELLKLWHTLASLRVVDVKLDVSPPDPQPKIEPIFAGDEPDPEQEPEPEAVKAAADVELMPDELPEMIGGEIVEPVSVRLIEQGTLRGMRLPAGIVIDVSPADAEHLIDTGKARLLEEGESRN